jgi:hypothetical protein
MAGATEGSWTIWRDANGARIVAEVRDSENFDLQLVKGEGEMVWKPAETAEPTIKGGNKERVLVELQRMNCELTAEDVAARLKIDRTVANSRLADLRNESKLQQRRRGHYCVAGAKTRQEGIYEAIMQSGVVQPVTTELKAKHDPTGKRSMMGDVEATGFAFTDDVVSAIEQAGFVNGAAAVRTLDVHKLLHEYRGVVWFFGASVNRTEQPLPWAVPATPKFPWS